jgi:glycerophosphoryl diester phosphodiesterase
MFRYFTFGGVIYTLYQLDISYQEVLDFVRDKSIFAIAVETERLHKRQSTILWLKSHGIKVYVFTVNDRAMSERVHKLGLDGIYTDTLIGS